MSAPGSAPSGRHSLWRDPGMQQLVILSVFGFVSFCVTLAALPSYAVQAGASRGTAGLVTTVMLAVTVATQAGVPALERRFGLGPVLAVGLVALGAPSPLYLVSDSLGWLIAVSAVRGVGFAILTVVGATLTTVVAPPERHGESIGIYGLAIAIPNLAFIPLGVALTLSGNFVWVAVIAAAPLLALPVAGPLGRAAAATTAVGEHHPRGSNTAAVRAALLPSLTLTVVTMAGGGLITFLPIERPSGVLATIALLAFGVTGALARWQAGLLADRTGSRLLLPLTIITGAVGLAGVAYALTLAESAAVGAFLVVAAAVFGIGYGATQNLTLVAAYRRAGRSNATTVSAVWNAAFDLGTGLGALVVGAVAAAGLGLPWTLACCAALVALTVFLVRDRDGAATASPAG